MRCSFDAFTKFLVRRHCCAFWTFLLIPLLLSSLAILVLIRAGGISEQSEYDWVVAEATTVKQADMVTSARGLSGTTDEDDDDDESQSIAKSKKAGQYAITFLYFWKEGTGGGGDMFAPAPLQEMCETENVVLGTAGYGTVCYFSGPSAPMTSVDGVNCSLPELSSVSLFYDSQPAVLAGLLQPPPGGLPSGLDMMQPQSHMRECTLLDADYVTDRAAQIYALGRMNNALRTLVGYFVSPDALTDDKTKNTRGMIDFGKPLLIDGQLTDQAELETAQYAFVDAVKVTLLDHFDMEARFFFSAWRAPAYTTHLEVKFLSEPLIENEFSDMSNTDFLMAFASILFVFFYVSFHTGSFALGFFGMVMIILSIPMAMFFYFVVFRIQYFAMIHNLAVFIVLGIGADDIFVFTDAWRQSSTMPPHISGSYSSRMLFTYKRTAQAVFNTSFTTAVAFFGTAVSPVMPVAAFGILAALAILMCYLLVITWWPAVIMVWELYLCRARFVGCCFPCIACCKVTKADLPLVSHAQDVSTPPGDSEAAVPLEKLRFVERLFHTRYAPLMTWSVRYKLLKPASIVLVIALFILGAFLTSRAVLLTPPTAQEQFLPSDHMVYGFGDLSSNEYLAGTDSAYETGALYLGLDGIDRPDFVKWVPDENRGTVVFDTSFDLSDGAAQAAFLELCADLRVATCSSSGCTKVPGRLVDGETLECFLEAFGADRAASNLTVPTGAAFLPALTSWMDGNPGWEKQVGLVDGVLKFAVIRYDMTLLRRAPPAVVRDVYDAFIDFLEAHFFDTAPPTLSSCFPYAGYSFSWMVTQERLVSGLFTGFGICFPVAFLVLLLATGSFLVAVYAIASIFLVVASLLGTCYLMGWELGISEAISGTIVIGLAVDYTVHLGHCYTESHFVEREAKMTDSATVMGVTVVAGAVTTFGCAFFMFFCQLTFFTKMALLIGGTIGYSVLYSLLFFMPLCALFGPSGKLTTTSEKLQYFCGSCSGGKAGVRKAGNAADPPPL